MRRALLSLSVVMVIAAGCGGSGGGRAASVAADPPPAPYRPTADPPLPALAVHGPFLAAHAVRSPTARVDEDENAANLASAGVTYGFGLLPEYIDKAGYRLLPFDVDRASTPGETQHRSYRLTVPHTHLILDTAMTTAQSRAEVRRDLRRMRVDVTLDGRHVARPERFWVLYRNNGPQICRIYFPDDLSSLQMAVNSIVWRPLAPGRHRLHVVLEQQLPPARQPARFVSDYELRVLSRPPNAHERALAPNEDGPKPNDRTPLTFRPPTH